MGNESFTKLIFEETIFYNSLVLPPKLCDLLPHFVQSWLRNCVFAISIYFVVTLSCVNFWKRHFSKGTVKIMGWQISMAAKGIPLGLTLHSGMEGMVLSGWTKCYPRISDVGFPAYLMYLSFYLLLLEFATYWAHRFQHHFLSVYKYVHRDHHFFRKEDSLTPMAGFAINPLESLLMGLPHVLAILIIPTHYTTHVVLLLIQSIWALIIHDRSNFLNYWPIMNAPYHTIHHTCGSFNFGNFTIFMDHFFGTLRKPNNSTDYRKEE